MRRCKTIDTDLGRIGVEEDIGKYRPELVNKKNLVLHHNNARLETSLATQ